MEGFNPFMTEADSYRNIDLRSKSMDWSLYDIGLRHERVKLDIKGKGSCNRFGKR